MMKTKNKRYMGNFHWVLLALALLTTASYGDSYKHISETLDAGDYKQLRLEFSVGELDIEIWDKETLELEIELEAERSWLSWRRRKVEDIELDIDSRGDELFLSIDEDNLNQEWVLKVPAKLAIEVEMGVGEVKIDGLINNLALDLGVGDIEVITADDNFDQIRASVGVGDVSLRGFGRGSENERSFVSADAFYQGQGEYRIEVELGVGDIEVDHY